MEKNKKLFAHSKIKYWIQNTAETALPSTKGQLISKENCQVVNSFKKRTNEFVFISMQCAFVRSLEEIEDSKKAFQNYLTFSTVGNLNTMGSRSL